MDRISTSDGPTRVVLLGASNLTLGFPHALRAVQRRLGGPLSIYAAHGHGRSYGVSSSVLVRQLPGILACGLWPALDAAARAPTYALLTDLGNDLVYGARPEAVMRWVQACVDRLVSHRAHVVITGLPLFALHATSARRFRFLARLFFPFHPVSREELVARAVELHDSLKIFSASQKLAWFDPEPGWYGLDPIHVRRRARQDAWQRIVSSWPRDVVSSSERCAPHWPNAWRLWSMPPEKRLFLGIKQHYAQPRWRGVDGTTIALY